METGILDHLLVILLIVLVPIKAMREYDHLLGRVRSGQAGARLRAYRRTLVWEWGLVAVLLVVWLLAGRSFVDLGLGFATGVKPAIGWSVVVAIAGLLLLQTRMVLRTPSGIESLRKELESLRELLPHGGREGRLFAALSVTAGICEELLYRGFLLAYFEHLLGLWPAVVLSSVVFGLGHAYQGTRGVFKTAAIGSLMAILFVLTGGLWAPMFVHAVVDLNSGYLGRRALEGWRTAAEAA